MSMKKVLVYDGKHDIEIWDASTPELKDKAFLSLFNVLDKDWQCYDDIKELEEPEKPSMTLEQIAQLPKGKVKEAAEKEHKEYKSQLSQYKDASYQKQLYEKAKAGDAKSAHLLLSTRNGYEYEGWRIVNVNEVK
jgi:hypothetical protein